MKILHKMLLAPAVAIALMVVVVAISFWAMREQRLGQQELTSRTLAARSTLDDVASEVAATRGDIYRMFTLLGNLDAKRVERERTALRDRLTGIAALLNKADFGQDEEMGKRRARCVAEIGKYMKKADDAIDLGSGDVNTGVAAMMTADDQYAEVIKAIQDGDAYIGRKADELTRRTESTSVLSFWLISGTLLAAIVAALLVAVRSARATARDLRSASEVAGKLADGDLGARFAIDSRDELGDLSHALDRMREAFAKMIGDIRTTSESVTVASSQIARGNSDLSARTEQQAGNLQQTAAS